MLFFGDWKERMWKVGIEREIEGKEDKENENI